jgi:nucleotide-binding universal stress UspA family protein
MKKILIALDYDPLAERVAATGYAIAKAFNAELYLLHVVDEPAYYSSVEYSPIMGFSGFNTTGTADYADTLTKEAVRFLEESRKHLGDPAINILVVEGDFADAIVTTANEISADLIVMGTQHRKGIDKLIMGSLAEKILNASSVPLLTIPAEKIKNT